MYNRSRRHSAQQTLSAGQRRLRGVEQGLEDAPYVPLFSRGDGGFQRFRIPTLIRLRSGTIVAFAEGSTVSWNDDQATALVCRRSTDGGKTWGPLITISSSTPTSDYLNNICPWQASNGTFGVFYVRVLNTLCYRTSSDDGLTWSAETQPTGLKVTGAGAPVGHAYPATAWTQTIPGPAPGIVKQFAPNAGRIVIPCYHRAGTATSWCHCMYSDDNGATWALGGGPDNTNAANNDANESTVVELANGNLYMNTRNRGGLTTRQSTVSTDGGATWSVMAAEAAQPNLDCEGSLLKLNATTYLVACPTKQSVFSGTGRGGLAIFHSTDSCATWSKLKDIHFGMAAYSAMCRVNDDQFLLVSECGQDVATDNAFDAWAYEIDIWRLSYTWLKNSLNAPYVHYTFSEYKTGTTGIYAGRSYRSLGPWDTRVNVQTSAAPPTVTAGSLNGYALTFTNSNNYLLMSDAGHYLYHPTATDSFTLEFDIVTTGTSQTLWSTKQTSPYVQVTISAAGKIVFAIHDGTFNPSVTTALSVNDGVRHCIACVRDVAADRLRVYIDGVEDANSNVTDTTTGTLRSDTAVNFGRFQDNSAHYVGTLEQLRYTQRALSSSELLRKGTPKKITAPANVTLPRFPISSAATHPLDLPGTMFYMPAYVPGLYCSDYYGTETIAARPVLRTDTAVHSFIDPAGKRLWTTNFQHTGHSSLERGYRIGSDAFVGKYLYNPGPAASGVGFVGPGTATLLDFLQNTATGTIAFLFYGTDFTALQTIYETNALTSANAGSYVCINATSRTLNCQISGPASTARFGASSTAALTSGVWNHCAVVYNGIGNAVHYYVTLLSSGSDPSQEVRATVGGSDGTYASANPVALGYKTAPDTGLATGSACVELTISTSAWSAANVARHFRYCKELINSGW